MVGTVIFAPSLMSICSDSKQEGNNRKRLGSVLSSSRKSLEHDRSLAPVIPPVPCAAIAGPRRSKLCSRVRPAGFIHVNAIVACATFSTAPVVHSHLLHRRLRDFQDGTNHFIHIDSIVACATFRTAPLLRRARRRGTSSILVAELPGAVLTQAVHVGTERRRSHDGAWGGRRRVRPWPSLTGAT